MFIVNTDNPKLITSFHTLWIIPWKLNEPFVLMKHITHIFLFYFHFIQLNRLRKITLRNESGQLSASAGGESTTYSSPAGSIKVQQQCIILEEGRYPFTLCGEFCVHFYRLESKDLSIFSRVWLVLEMKWRGTWARCQEHCGILDYVRERGIK